MTTTTNKTTKTRSSLCGFSKPGLLFLALCFSFQLVFAQADMVVGTGETFTIPSAVPAQSGATYQWLENGQIIPGADQVTYSTFKNLEGSYMYIRQAKKDPCPDWVSSNLYIVQVESSGTVQPQGTCSYTQPPAFGTFASFPGSYSASTFTALTDERDNQIYTVVKMPDGKWWMAENLNYQKDLYWDQRSDRANGSAFTTTTNGIPAIGSFWCPAGNAANTVTSSPDRAGCTLYGALYTYEAAMMVDGKWSDDAHSSKEFVEPAYATATSSGNDVNHGRGSTKRGICPPNWHVPTDFEWGDMLNKVGLLGTNFNNGYNAWLGTNNNAGEAGARLKAKCTCPSTNEFCATDVINDWRYTATSANVGTDVYGFRVVPVGYRTNNGSDFTNRVDHAVFWSSSAYSATVAWSRHFNYAYSQVSRHTSSRSGGFSVRCVRD
jgi:uncharacterized protein (TIGR02145 family)